MKARKLFTLLLTMLVLFVFAAPTMVKATQTRKTNVTIHKMELFTNPGGLPKDHDGTVLTPEQLDAALGAGNYSGLPGVVFKYWKVNSSDTVAALEGLSIAQLDATFTTNAELTPTNANGVITVTDLEDGYYYFKEINTPANVTKQIAVPFILGLPVMKKDGSGFIKDLHIYPKNLTVRGAVVLTKMAGGNKLAGAEFRLYKGISPEGVEYVPEGGTAKAYKTNAQGEIIMNNLPKNDYYFKETATVSPNLLDQTPIPFKISANGKVTVVNGLKTDHTGDVKFVKHYNFEEPDIDKSIGTSGINTLSADYNEKFSFILDLDLPADITEYTHFVVSDTISSKLDYKNELLVQGSVNGSDWITLTSSEHFEIPAQPAMDGDGLLRIAFIPSKLKSGDVSFKEIKITFKAAINETAIMGQDIPNTAVIDYNNGYVVGNEPSDEVKAHTGGKNFKKTDGAIGLEGAEFAVKNAAGKFLKVVAGEYQWVNTLGETAFRLTSDANGFFQIKGLEYGPGGTKYYLYETKAPMSSAGYPYMLMEDDIEFLVTGTSFYTDPAAIESGAALPTATPENVLNILGPQIPQTGGMGTILFTLVGGGLMGSALMLNKKRSRA